MAGNQQRRAKEEAKVARGVVEAMNTPVTVLPGVISDRREVTQVDWEAMDPRQMIPYATQLPAYDHSGEYRRQRMDNLVLGVMRYGEASLSALAAQLGVGLDDQLGYAVPTVLGWYEADVDGFRDRVKHANGVFKGRLIFAIMDRADKPYVPREYFRDNVPLFGVLNAFIPEHFKRSGQVTINTGDQVTEIHKTLVMVGEAIIKEQQALHGARK